MLTFLVLPSSAETILGVSRGKSDGGYIRRYALLHGGVSGAPAADVSGLEYGESRQGTVAKNAYGFAVYYNAYAESLGIWINENSSYNRYKSYFKTAKMDQYGKKTADDPTLTDEATFLRGNTMTGSDFSFVSDDYWFYLEKTEYPKRIYFHNESKMTINISTESLVRDEPTITIYRINRSIPMTSRTDGYCSIKFRANVPCDGTVNRSIIVYYNGVQVGEQQNGVIFPNRTIEASDLSVSTKAGYKLDHVDASGSTYKVYLVPTSYTVVFNGNGNTGGSMSNQSFTYDVAQKLTANAYTKTGYRFTSWNTAANGSGTKYENQQSVSKLTSKDGGTVTLYAQWTLDTYTVSGSIDNGGSVTNSSQSIDYGKASAAMVFTPATDYKITGVSINGTAQSLSFPLSTYTYPVQSLVAQDITVSVTTSRYYPVTGSIDNGGTVSNSSQSIRSGSQNAAMVFTPATGYEIKSVKVNGTEQLSGNPVSTYTYPAQTISGAKTVIATTALKKYTVSGSMDHGSVTGTPQTVNHGSASAAMVFTPTMGYKITAVSINGTAQSLSFPLNTYTYPAQSSVTQNITVSVTATATTYTLTLNANGGSVSTPTKDYTIVDAIQLPTPSWGGRVFDGWKVTTATGSWAIDKVFGPTALAVSAGQYGNATLTAQWSLGDYTAKFNANGGTVDPASKGFLVTQDLVLPTPVWLGHEFKGWKVTTADGSWTSGTIYTGSSIAKGQWGNVTFTAQWEAIPKGNLKIEVDGLKDDDMAVCKVVSETAGLEHAEYTVAISATEASVTLKDIYAGSYTVTSGEWQWAYIVSGDNPQVVAVEGNKTVTVTITLAPKSGTPKHDEDNVVNVLGK